jgi:glycosyltransferase involved in cell wall biosynthesis
VVSWRGDPTRLLGQRDLLRVPGGDVVVYLHQVRPLRPGRSVTVIHDTIPLRYGGSRPVRALKGLFLRVAARLSDRIVTVSSASRDAIVRDLGVGRSRIVVASLGVDSARVARIRALRAGGEREDVALFVGRFAAHKNLRRLCRAFAVTGFAAAGGRLVLVGGTPAEAADMAAWARDEGLGCVDARAACPEDELDRLLATCRALVQPSLEEGYGLPAVEAAAVGVQVATSPTGAAPTIPSDRLTLMEPRDEASIAAAIDAAVDRRDPTAEWRPQPTVAAEVVGALRSVLEPR